MEKHQVVVSPKTNEIIEPALLNKSGSLIRGNGVVHVVCAQIVNYALISDTHAALHCSRCGLRVVFPASVTTFSELKAHLASGAKTD